MVYTSATYPGKTYSRVVSTEELRRNGYKPVVLNGVITDGVYSKTGPYCPVRYEPEPDKRRAVIIPPPKGVAYTDYTERHKRRRW